MRQHIQLDILHEHHIVDGLPVDQWIERVRAEYLEMPGLCLTKPQMRRLWLIDSSTCDVVVDSLVASAFLRRRADDTYVRGEWSV
jgi:hypothetical protein